MPPALPATHQRLAVEAELSAGQCRFVREKLRLPMGIEASFGWLRHPPTVLVVPHTADRRFLLLRRYHPAAGQWLLEFPSGVLLAGESPPAGAARLLQQLTGCRGETWRGLGVLRPNPGYSDEQMTVGWMEVEAAAALDFRLGTADLQDSDGGSPYRPQLWLPEALELALMADEEPVDGRCVSAWFLARQSGHL